MACHDDLFTDHGCEIDRHTSSVNLLYIICIILGVNVVLPLPVKAIDIYCMRFSFIVHFGAEFLEKYFDSVIECKDMYIEFEWSQESYIIKKTIKHFS